MMASRSRPDYRRPRHLPPAARRRGRGRESDEVTAERGRLDAVIAEFLFMAGMRRSEVSALRWADVEVGAGTGVMAAGLFPLHPGLGQSPRSWACSSWARSR